jgi:hypothetical protein
VEHVFLMGGAMECDDGLIACTPAALIIRRYDMFLRPKRIPYAEIRAVTEVPIGSFRRWRLWGTTDPRLWFNLDTKRPHKSVGFIINTGRRVHPVITPDDPQQVLAVLRSHGVQINQS